MRDASVVVATSNRATLVRRAVACLLDQDYPRDRYEVIVADDASTDDTEQQLAPLVDAQQIRYVRLKRRGGAGMARNAGIAASNGAIVIFVDSDAFAPPSFVRAHVAAHRGTEPVVVDGPAINIAGVDLECPLPFHSWSHRLQATLGYIGRPFVTANASCRRDALRAVKGFDEAFGARYGWEDTELYLRLRAAGLKRVRARHAWLLHLDDATRHWSLRGMRRFECGVNAALLYQKHRSRETLRLVGTRVLMWDSWLRRAGITVESLERRLAADGSRGWQRYLVAELYLLRRYADGLRVGRLA